MPLNKYIVHYLAQAAHTFRTCCILYNFSVRYTKCGDEVLVLCNKSDQAWACSLEQVSLSANLLAKHTKHANTATRMK